MTHDSKLCSAASLSELIGQHRFVFSDEDQLHQELSKLMQQESIPYEAEVRLTPRDRIDFMVGRVGVEVKIKHPLSSVIRQLHRYAQNPEIDELLLVTSKASHTALPLTINGKPLHVAFLAWGMLG